MKTNLISIHEVADRLGVTLRSVQTYVKIGWIAPVLEGRPSYFDPKEVERFAKKLPKMRAKPGPKPRKKKIMGRGD